MKKWLLFLLVVAFLTEGIFHCKAYAELPLFLGYDGSECFYSSLEGSKVIRVLNGIGEQFTNGLAKVRNEVNKQTAVYNSRGMLIVPWTEMLVNITSLSQGFSIITLYSMTSNSETEGSTISYIYSQNSGSVTKVNKHIDLQLITTGPPFWYVERELYGLMDAKGKILTLPKYSIVSRFINGYAFVSGDIFQGYIGRQGEEEYEVSRKWSYSYGVYDNTMVVSREEIKDDKILIYYNVIDLNGNKILPQDYAWCSEKVSDGWVRVKNDDSSYSYHSLHSKGKMKVCWKNALDFSNGFAAVQDDFGRWGFIDLSGELVIPCQFDYIGQSWDGLDGFDQFGRVWVSRNGDDFMIDKAGSPVSPLNFKYAGYYCVNNNPIYLITNQSNQMGVLDSYGHIVLGTSFDIIELSNNQYLCGARNGFLFYFDLTGHLLTKHSSNK